MNQFCNIDDAMDFHNKKTKKKKKNIETHLDCKRLDICKSLNNVIFPFECFVMPTMTNLAVFDILASRWSLHTFLPMWLPINETNKQQTKNKQKNTKNPKLKEPKLESKMVSCVEINRRNRFVWLFNLSIHNSHFISPKWNES